VKTCNITAGSDSSPNIIMMFKSSQMRWVKHTACMRAMKNAHKILVRISDQATRPRHVIWENKIKLNMKETG
jgi:hypothetical protein